jgi:hypothetical protein
MLAGRAEDLVPGTGVMGDVPTRNTTRLDCPGDKAASPAGGLDTKVAEAIDNLAPDSIETIEQARAAIAQTRELVSAVAVDDAKPTRSSGSASAPDATAN